MSAARMSVAIFGIIGQMLYIGPNEWWTPWQEGRVVDDASG